MPTADKLLDIFKYLWLVHPADRIYSLFVGFPILLLAYLIVKPLLVLGKLREVLIKYDLLDKFKKLTGKQI